MKNINLNDEVKVKDSDKSIIKGIFTLKNSNGKIIFSKENMILKSGRELIKETIFQSNTISPLNFKLYLSTDQAEPNPDYTGTGADIREFSLTADDFTYDSANISVTITKTISSDDTTGTFYSAGLKYEDILFSRVTFPSTSITQPINEDSPATYQITYTIYF